MLQNSPKESMVLSWELVGLEFPRVSLVTEADNYFARFYASKPYDSYAFTMVASVHEGIFISCHRVVEWSS